MKLGNKFVWVDPLDQTLDNEVLVYIGTVEHNTYLFCLDGGDGSVWVGLEENELDWIRPLGE